MIRVLLATALLCLTLSAQAGTEAHPFARVQPPASLDLSFGGLEWGPTTLSYSHAWSGGHDLSQGSLLKSFRLPLASGLDFRARFGLAFQPLGDQTADGQAQFTLPYAALHWQPSEHFSLHLEYSRPSWDPTWNRFDAFGSRGWGADPFDDAEDPAGLTP